MAPSVRSSLRLSGSTAPQRVERRHDDREEADERDDRTSFGAEAEAEPGDQQRRDEDDRDRLGARSAAGRRRGAAGVEEVQRDGERDAEDERDEQAEPDLARGDGEVRPQQAAVVPQRRERRRWGRQQERRRCRRQRGVDLPAAERATSTMQRAPASAQRLQRVGARSATTAASVRGARVRQVDRELGDDPARAAGRGRRRGRPAARPPRRRGSRAARSAAPAASVAAARPERRRA